MIPFVKKCLKSAVNRAPDTLDAWIVSTIHRRIITETAALEEMKIRRASATAFLDTWNDIRHYLRRAKAPRKQTLSDVFGAWNRMVAPFTPFMAEDLNHELGGKGLISQADWPSPKDLPIDEKAELAESTVERVIEDARNILKVVKGERSKLNIYVSSDEAKAYFFELIQAKKGGQNVGQVVKKYSALRIPPDRIFKLAYELGDEALATMSANRGFNEFSALSEAEGFISKEIGVRVVVQKAGSKGIRDPANKAKDALPSKTALFFE
jgi:leucyl-tRNA synthetase